jgi:hypothetical protein
MGLTGKRKGVIKMAETEITLQKGERHVVTIGNVVVDILCGYREGRALIEIYSVDDTKPMEGHIRVEDGRYESLSETKGWLILK